MNTPLISVIIPVYKAEKYLDKCISSITEQSFNNLEIILVDDGSPDNCPKICDEWAEKDSRIKVIHKANGGVSAARNTALKTANGEYIAFVDSDDWIDSDYIEVLYNAISECGADVSCAGIYYEYLNGDQEISVSERRVLNKNCLEEYLFDMIRPEISTKLYSRKAINGLEFDTDFNYSEDVLYNYCVFKNCDKAIILDVPEYHYLQESGESSTTPYITDIRAKSYQIYIKFVEDCKGTEYYNAAIWRFTRSVISILSRVMAVEEFRDKYFNEISDSFKPYLHDILANKHISLRNKTIVLVMCLNKKLFKLLVQNKYGRK